MDLPVKDIFVQVSGRDLFKIACKRPCGAISITIAFSGICLLPSSKSTGFNRLFVKYSAEQYLDNDLSHSHSGTEVLIHFEERFFGYGITYLWKM